jgi:pheromone shutdown protein TraB
MHVYGTSHVSERSIETIDRAFDQHVPDVVALELDPMRLQALLQGKHGEGGSVFVRLLRAFQKRVGESTGMFPGSEMVHAYRKAEQKGLEIALIDQDARITFSRLQDVPRKERVKAVAELVLALFLPLGKDVSEIPDEAQMLELIETMERRYPEMHRVLVEERNDFMAESLRKLEQERPGAEIVAFVGAGHMDGLERRLNEGGSEG